MTITQSERGLTWTSRIMREYYVRFCERLGLKCPCLLGETGITDINTARLIEIANYFNVRPALFFEDTEETKKMEEDRRLRDAQFRKMETMVNELQEKLIVTLQENNLLYKKVAN
jgi:hypothetical protein